MTPEECEKWCLYSLVFGGCIYKMHPVDCKKPWAPSAAYFDHLADEADKEIEEFIDSEVY